MFCGKASQANRNRYKIAKVGDHFGKGGIGVITKQSFKQRSEKGILIQDKVDVPYMVNKRGNPAQLVEFMNAESDQTGGEKDQKNPGDLEKAPQTREAPRLCKMIATKRLITVALDKPAQTTTFSSERLNLRTAPMRIPIIRAASSPSRKEST